MAKSFLTDINLNRNVLLNAKIQAWGSAPTGTGSPDGSGNAVAGQISSYLGALWIFTGAGGTPANTWVQVGTGTVTSVTGTSPVSSSGGATPAISLAANYGDTLNPYASKTANFVLAAPNGTAGVPTFRALVAADIPTLNQNTTGSAGSVANGLTFGANLTATTGSSPYNGSAATTIALSATPTGVTSINTVTMPTSGSFITSATTSLPSVTTVNGTTIPSSATLLTSASTSSALTSVGTLGGLTMGGNIVMGNNKITGLGTPTAGDHAATKDYVDNVSTGINIHDAVVAATTGTIAGVYAAGSTTANPPGDGGTGVGATITYSATGTTTLDTSVTLALYDRVLVKDGVTAAAGASSIANGVYTVTTAGTTGVATVLTRATDSDNSIFGDLTAGDLVYVIGGSTYGGDQFVQTVKGTATSGSGAGTVYSVKIGTDAISYTQFSGAGAVPYATDTVAGIAQFPTAQFTVNTGSVAITALAASVLSGTVSSARGITSGSSTGSFVAYNGTTVAAGQFDGGTTDPTGTTRLNYGGNLYATNFYGNGANLTSVSATTATATESTSGTVHYPVFATSGTGSKGLLLNAAGTNPLSYKPSTGELTTTILSTPTISATNAALTVSGGGNSGNAWAVTVNGGDSSSATTGTGGAATLRGGNLTNTTATGTGGGVTITGGTATAGTVAATAGSVGIAGGAANTTAGIGGDVNILGGNGFTKGTINIGTSQTASLTIGASGITTTINGTTVINGTVLTLDTTVATFRSKAVSGGSGATTGNVTIGTGIASGGSGTATSGNVLVDVGYATGASSVAGTISIGTRNAAGTSNVYAAPAAIAIGQSGVTTTVTGGLSIPTIASATGLLKTTITTGVVGLAAAGTDYIAPYGSTTANTFLAAPNGSAGTPSFRTVVYADLPTSSLTGVTTDGIARKKSGTLTANSSTTAFAINHAFGQWVTAQVFDATSGNLVEVDVQNASTNSGTTTFTFATAPTTGTNYQYVIIG